MPQADLVHEYPCNVSRLWSTFSDPGYLREKYRALGQTDLTISLFEAAADHIEVRLERPLVIQVGQLPAWLRRLAPQSVMLQQHTRLTRRSTELLIDSNVGLLGLPVSALVQGRGWQPPGLDRTAFTLRVDARCGVPVLGRRIAEAVEARVRQSLAEDHAFTAAYVRDLT